jgi:hypothetical protein
MLPPSSPQTRALAIPPALPAILGLRRSDCLPLHIPDRIRPATRERHDVVPDVARAATAARSGRRARLLALELARDLSGAMFFR